MIGCKDGMSQSYEKVKPHKYSESDQPEVKKYRLLRDLPSVKAGVVGEYNEADFQYTFRDCNTIKLDEHIVENNSDWFEPVIDYKEELKKMGWDVYDAHRKTALRLADDIGIYADSFKDIYEVVKGRSK